MKRISVLLFALLITVSLFACDKREDPIIEIQVPTEKVRVVSLQGPTGMGLSQIIKEMGEIYDVSLVSSAEMTSIAAKVINGECDICAVPINFASVLYNKTEGKVKIIGSATKGVLHMLSNSDEIKSIGDLKGKNIYATGQGSTPEYVLKYVLKKNGIDPEKDVKITFVQDHAELATLLSSDVYGIGMLPEPNATTVVSKNPKFKYVLDMTEEWNKVCESELIQGVYIATADFAEKHPEKISEFLDALRQSVDFVNAYPGAAAMTISENKIIPDRTVAEKAIPKCNIVCGKKEAYDDIYACLEVLFGENAASVGGKLPEKAELFF